MFLLSSYQCNQGIVIKAITGFTAASKFKDNIESYTINNNANNMCHPLWFQQNKLALGGDLRRLTIALSAGTISGGIHPLLSTTFDSCKKHVELHS